MHACMLARPWWALRMHYKKQKPLPQPQEQPEHLFIFYCVVGAVSIWEMKN